ncbi:MAG: sulfate transporter CysZ [Gammaproteobacteria bacterium]|nr:MAG: sulfate transporter CysZ [Gammaproteobacteria bacterium]
MISFTKGFLDCFGGFSLLFKPGIKRFVLIPFFINLGLFLFATKLLSEQLTLWLDKLLPDWLSWLEWLIWPLFAIALFLIVFYTFTVLANLIAAPFNSLLSARIEAFITGSQPEEINTGGFIKLVFRTLKSEIQKILYAVKWFIPLLIITVIPVINIAAPFLWILFAVWFFALEYNDYPLANRGLYFAEVKAYNRKNRMRSLGLGTAVFIMTSIPLVNFFAMPIAIAGATKSITKADQQNRGTV